MAPSLRDRAFRPTTRDRPTSTAQDHQSTSTREHGDHSLIIPSRTSSLHSRITQPIPSTLNIKPSQRTPKTLTHAYMVCGVGREPSQWVRAPAPLQGKIAHMKGAIGQYWLPEILGSSPRLDQDNEIARSLHAAMRVRTLERVLWRLFGNLTSLGLLSSRRRSLHWAEPATLRSPFLCSPTRFISHSLRHCFTSLVSS